MFGEENHEEVNCNVEGCKGKVSKVSTVCVPVTIMPFAKVGEIYTECLGEPEVSDKHHKCKGVENGNCKFTISQKIKVEIPVEFGANTTVGDTFVECECMNRDEDAKEYHD